MMACQTSLLSAIIGEMLKTEGELTLCGTVAYCPQNPWSVLSKLSNSPIHCFAKDYECYCSREYSFLSHV